jgi:acyl-homoserine-lactone acylase
MSDLWLLVRRPLRAISVASGAVLFVVLAAACSALPNAVDRSTAPEILWDQWGVPHVYASDDAGLFHALGWAETQSHGDLVLQLYGRARGRAAECWGKDWLESDRWVRTMGIPERARQWYEQQTPQFRRNLDEFAAGINEYAAAHGDRLSESARCVLPVTAIDVLAHTQRVIHFSFIGRPQVVAQARQAVGDVGSNAWAIAPSRSANGHSMLLINPHLAWAGEQLFYEVHLVAPGIDVYGATLVGFPVISLGFNRQLGWSHTVNTFDGADAYELTLANGGYRFDGAVHAFEVEQQTLLVRQDDGTLRPEALTVRRSVHGPVIAEGKNTAVALRVVGLDAPGMLQQWWDMGRATGLQEFESALRRLQVPMFNVLYADSDGHVLYVFNGRVPRRAGGTYADWLGIVPGDSSANLWTSVLGYDELPRILDPATGWLQNANDPPWTATLPSSLDPQRFPSYIAPSFMHLRAQQSARLLQSNDSITFDEMIGDKHSTRMLLADRVLDDLIASARAHGNDSAKRAAEILAAWDRRGEATSRGAVLFERWVAALQFDRASVAFDDASRRAMVETFTTTWRPTAPDSTPAGLKATERGVEVLARVADDLLASQRELDVPWGEMHRLRLDGHDLPASGADGDPLGVFRTVWFGPPGSDGVASAVGGDSFYAAVEFAATPRARVLLAYGNSSQPKSRHAGDQLELFARGEMRTPWLDRADIEAHLESRERFEPSRHAVERSTEIR